MIALKMIERLQNELLPLREELKNHPIYKSINDIDDLKKFMESHVFAVWDFMSLLKQLQNHLSCNIIPWSPSGYPKASRLINEIVWGEESDINKDGVAMSHFEMYIEAMKSINANTEEIDYVINAVKKKENIFKILSNSSLPKHIIDFLKFTFEVVNSNNIHVIAAVFTFGREDLIPDMFIQIIKNLKIETEKELSDIIYYFERHIEVDSDEHGPLALEMIQQLCGNDSEKWEEALKYSKKALQLRIGLWDGIMTNKKNKLSFA